MFSFIILTSCTSKLQEIPFISSSNTNLRLGDGFSCQYKLIRMGVNMSSSEIFVILLIITSSVGEYREKIKKRENQLCDVIIRDVKAEITSPGYPNEYPSFSNCHYTILPSNDAICQVSIDIIDLDLEESPNCFKDKLLIGEKSFCGRFNNYRIIQNLTKELKIQFLTDSEKTGHGFRLRLEQIHCGNIIRYQGQSIRECCSREYSEPYFVLTSPGFLTTEWTDSNCRYIIHSSSENVCRLRLKFKHFWVGDEDVFYGCVNGFLEIDKRRFCGCMDGYEYVSNFDESRRKELWYSHRGNGNRGFIIEVSQEECSPFGNRTEFDPNTEIEVFMTNMTSEKAISRFLIPRNGFRCRDWGHPEWIRSVLSIVRSEPCESVTASQFYPFPEDSIPVPVDPVFPIPPPVFYPRTNCLDFPELTGFFTSPNYPGRYPSNFQRCYRFIANPFHCRLRLQFTDFNLEKSFKCWKDYLLIYGRHRYCGDYFHRKEAILDFDQNGIVLLNFVSDWCFSGRGFYVRFTQLPCLTQFGRFMNQGNNSDIITDNGLN